MAEIIKCSIDLNKIDKSKIKTVELKKGGTGKFLDIIIFIKDEQDEYGNIASVSLGQTKEESEKAVAKVYIGNGKRTWTSGPKAKDPVHDEVGGQSNIDEGDDLPF